MTVTLLRKSFSPEERELIVEAVMTGSCPPELPELEDIALTIAEWLPSLLAKARLPDTSDNRRAIINLVLTRWGMPKSPRPSTSYRRLAARR